MDKRGLANKTVNFMLSVMVLIVIFAFLYVGLRGYQQSKDSVNQVLDEPENRNQLPILNKVYEEPEYVIVTTAIKFRDNLAYESDAASGRRRFIPDEDLEWALNNFNPYALSKLSADELNNVIRNMYEDIKDKNRDSELRYEVYRKFEEFFLDALENKKKEVKENADVYKKVGEVYLNVFVNDRRRIINGMPDSDFLILANDFIDDLENSGKADKVLDSFLENMEDEDFNEVVSKVILTNRNVASVDEYLGYVYFLKGKRDYFVVLAGKGVEGDAEDFFASWNNKVVFENEHIYDDVYSLCEDACNLNKDKFPELFDQCVKLAKEVKEKHPENKLFCRFYTEKTGFFE